MNNQDANDMHFLEKIEGTKYPYYTMDGPLRRNLNKFKSILAPINPFKLQQVPSQDRLAFFPHSHGRSWVPNALPNSVEFDVFLHFHNDPLSGEYKTPSYNLGKESTATRSNFKINKEFYPIACIRSVNKFDRCKLVNGEEKCQEEGNDILQICPNFILQKMRKNKLKKENNRLTQIREYNEAMEVADYNKGRTISDVPEWKRYIHGTREHLRPDTFWADERYVNITQEDIDQAKLRHNERVKQSGVEKKTGIYKQPPISKVYTHVNFEKPLYK